MTLSRLLNSTARLSAIAGASIAFAMAPALGQDVSLRSPDGAVTLRGELVGFEDNHYILATPLGDIRISADRMTCEGAACPEPGETIVASSRPVAPSAEAEQEEEAPSLVRDPNFDVMVVGSGTISDRIMPSLLSGYATFLEGVAEVQEIDDDDAPSGEDEVIASIFGDGGAGEEIVSYRVVAAGSSDGFEMLLSGVADIGLATRAVREEEIAAFLAQGAGDVTSVEQERVVAFDTVAIIVHPDNPLDGISLSSLAGIYSGEITNWSELGGPDAAINAYTRQEGSGTARSVAAAIFGDPDTEFAETINVADGTSEMTAAINEDPFAIGFASYARRRGAQALDLVLDCGITVPSDPFTVRAEEYIFQRRFYVYSTNEPSEEAERFLNFITSEVADPFIDETGFIGLEVTRRAQDDGNGRLLEVLRSTEDTYELGVVRQLMIELLDWDRLSTTFRFAFGSAALDAKGQLDMIRLVNYLEQQPEGTRVAIVGFTDNEGSFESNESFSLARAREVAAQIDAAAQGRLGNIEFSARGFGELAPVACNDTPEGRSLNRRVEIWIEG